MQYLCGSEPDLTQLLEVSEFDMTLTLRQCLLYVRLMLEKVCRKLFIFCGLFLLAQW